MKVIKWITALAMVSPIISCQSTPQKKFDYALFTGQCSEALTQMPENQESVKFLRASQEASGTALSYTVTGLGYTSDAVITVAGGVVIFVVLCGPILVASAVGGGGAMAPACLPATGIVDNLKPTQIGKNTFKSTEHWRCPNLQPLSRSIEKVADCYSARGDAESLKSAAKTLASLEQSKKFYQCLPAEDQNRITEKLNEVKKSLAI